MDVKAEGRKALIEEFELAEAEAAMPRCAHKKGRTALQKVIEDVEKMDLEEILDRVEPMELARRYHLDLSTVSKWKARLGWWESKETA